MSKDIELARELYAYTRIVGSHNKHIQDVAKQLLDRLTSLEVESDMSPTIKNDDKECC